MDMRFTKTYSTKDFADSRSGYVREFSMPQRLHISEVKKIWKKFPENFESRTGVCYIDNDGKEYTYDDILGYTMSEKGTLSLFNDLQGKTPERTASGKWEFKKCPRCGGFIYVDENDSYKKDSMCARCTPVRTNGHICVPNDPYDDNRKFYRRGTAVFEPGVTTLIGCNGIGKSTLLLHIRDELKQRGTPHLYFDNLGEEGGENMGRSILSRVIGGYGGKGIPVSVAASLYTSSEGEKIATALNAFTEKIVSAFKKSKGYGEFWVLFDAIDSGLSLDMIEDVKKYLFDELCKLSNEDNRIYIISSSNSFELSEGTKCFSIEKMRYVNANTFPAYRKAVLSSRRFKEKRDEILRVFGEVANMAFAYDYNEKLVGETRQFHKGTIEGDMAVLTVGGYRMTVHMKSRGGTTTKTCFIERLSDGKKFSCKKYEDEIFDVRDSKERLRKEMHEVLCRVIAKEMYRAKKA